MTILMSVKQVCDTTGFGKTFIYSKLKSGELAGRKCGRKTVVLRSDLEAFIANLENYKGGNNND
jgi:excisionase family DNA binding protein